MNYVVESTDTILEAVQRGIARRREEAQARRRWRYSFRKRFVLLLCGAGLPLCVYTALKFFQVV